MKFNISTNYEFYIDSVMCRIENYEGVYYTYINNEWTEDKESSLEEALEKILQKIGISKQNRIQLINDSRKLNPEAFEIKSESKSLHTRSLYSRKRKDEKRIERSLRRND